MTVSPANPATVYRTIHTAQAFWSIDRSTDGGVTWQTIEGPRGSGQAYQIAVSPADPDRIYIPYVDALGYGVLVSSDSGAYWKAIDTPGQFTAVAADPRNADHLWLGGPGGLYVSSDAGASLTRLSSTPVTALALDPGNPRHLLIGGGSSPAPEAAARTGCRPAAEFDPPNASDSGTPAASAPETCAPPERPADQQELVGLHCSRSSNPSARDNESSSVTRQLNGARSGSYVDPTAHSRSIP